MSKELDLDAIEALAKAATPGRREYITANGGHEHYLYAPDARYESLPGNDSPVKVAFLPWSPAGDRPVRDGRFMAAMDPETTLALVQAVRDRDAEIATLKARLAMAVSFQADEFSVIEPGDDDGQSLGFWQVMRSGDGVVLTDRGDWINTYSDAGEARFPTADAAFAALDAYRAVIKER